MNDLPIIPEEFKLLPNARTMDHLKVIGELAKRSDLLVNSCDAGREGQHIFSLIQRYLEPEPAGEAAVDLRPDAGDDPQGLPGA